MGDGLDEFGLRDAVLLGPVQVKRELLSVTAGYEGCNGDEAPVTFRQFRTLPDVAEQDVVRQLHQLG